MTDDTPTIEWLEKYYTPKFVVTCLEKWINPAKIERAVATGIPLAMAPSTFKRLQQHWGITDKNCNEIPMTLTEFLARERLK